MRLASLALAAALLSAPSVARAEEPSPLPPTIGGGVLVGLGLGSIALSPVCTYRPGAVAPCATSSILGGLAAFGGGVALLELGAERRAALRVRVVGLPGGAALVGRW